MQALEADKRMVKVVSLAGLSCEDLASESRCKMQVALLAEPKTPLESSVFI